MDEPTNHVKMNENDMRIIPFHTVKWHECKNAEINNIIVNDWIIYKQFKQTAHIHFTINEAIHCIIVEYIIIGPIDYWIQIFCMKNDCLFFFSSLSSCLSILFYHSVNKTSKNLWEFSESYMTKMTQMISVRTFVLLKWFRCLIFVF